MFRDLVCAAGAALLFVAGTTAASAQCDSGERVLRFSHVTADYGHPKGEAAIAVAERINADMNGRMCMVVYPRAELFDDDDTMLAALTNGDLEFAAPSASKLGGVSTQFQLFDLPFLFRNTEHLIDFSYSDAAQSMLRAGQDKGIVGVALWINGMRQITSDRPITMPSDLAGTTMRISGSKIGAAYYDSLGAETKRVSFSKLYGALEAGEVNGQENTWTNIYGNRLYEVQDGVTETNHNGIMYFLITSDRFLNSLTPADRDQLLQIVAEVSHERNRFAFELGEMAKFNIMDEGGLIRRLSDAQRSAWIQAMRPIWGKFEGEVGVDLIDATQQF